MAMRETKLRFRWFRKRVCGRLAATSWGDGRVPRCRRSAQLSLPQRWLICSDGVLRRTCGAYNGGERRSNKRTEERRRKEYVSPSPPAASLLLARSGCVQLLACLQGREKDAAANANPQHPAHGVGRGLGIQHSRAAQQAWGPLWRRFQSPRPALQCPGCSAARRCPRVRWAAQLPGRRLAWAPSHGTSQPSPPAPQSAAPRPPHPGTALWRPVVGGEGVVVCVGWWGWGGVGGVGALTVGRPTALCHTNFSPALPRPPPPHPTPPTHTPTHTHTPHTHTTTHTHTPTPPHPPTHPHTLNSGGGGASTTPPPPPPASRPASCASSARPAAW